MTNHDPHQVRILARTATYANAIEERENIRRVDKEVFDRVRLNERHIIATAEVERAQAVELEKVAVNLNADIQASILTPLRQGARWDDSFAVLAQQAQDQAQQLLGELQREATALDWHASRIADPYGTYIEMTNKYTMLRPAIPVQE